jgi:hypothetical protein
MKLLVSALATALALSISLAFAEQNDNGLNLGKSMPGTNAGVPYPNRAVTDRTAPVASGGAMRQGSAHRKHRKHHRA